MTTYPFHPHGYTIFCEDVRTEVGGKLSYMGCYEQSLIIQGEFPFTVPKFVCVTNYLESATSRPDSVQIMIFLPGDAEDQPSQTADVQFAESEREGKIVQMPDGVPIDDDALLEATVFFTFTPLVLRTEGEICVRVRRDGDIIRIGHLFVRKGEAA